MQFRTDRNLRSILAALAPSSNLFQSAALLLAFGTLITLAAWPEVGGVGLAIAILEVAAILVLALRLPPGAAMRLYGARPHDPASLKQVEALLTELAQRAGLARTPHLYVVPSSMITAFSAGTTQRGAIAVTEGLLRQLTMREIAGVLAREVAHVRRGDLLVLSIADLVTRFAQALYYAGLALAALNLFRLIADEEPVSWWTVALLILAPALLNLLQLSLPKSRELAADTEGARATGDPLGLASAISRLDTSSGRAADDLIPPVPARKVPRPSMLRCPPPDEARIAHLRTLEVPPMPPLDVEEGPRISLIGVGPIAMRPRYRWPGVWF